MQLILASSSIARKKILESLGLKFKVIPSHIDETKISATNPKLLVQKIARAKAQAVAKNLKEGETKDAIAYRLSPSFSPSPSFPSSSSSPSGYLIIAADSMVVLGNRVKRDTQTIGKPKDKKEAKEILKMLSGRSHHFLTSLYVINTKTNKTWQRLAVTKVTFRKLKDKEVNAYLKKTDATRFAGGYTIVPPQDFNLQTIKKGKSEIIKKIDGSLTNVIGLPLEVLLPILRENGINC